MSSKKLTVCELFLSDAGTRAAPGNGSHALISFVFLFKWCMLYPASESQYARVQVIKIHKSKEFVFYDLHAHR